jgi:predicted transcriptional regulator
MCAIVLRMSPDLLGRVDDVRESLSMSRTSWLRKAIRRQLEFTQDHELPLVQDPAIRRALQP